MNVVSIRETNTNEPIAFHQPRLPRLRWWQRRWLRVVLGITTVVLVALIIAAEWVVKHAEPIIRARVVETMSARFHQPVELDGLSISLVEGIQVQGRGLRVLSNEDAEAAQSRAKPTVSVDQFSFRTTVKGLLHEPTNIHRVYVEGLKIDIPPSGKRAPLLGARNSAKGDRRKIKLLFDDIVCRDVTLLIESKKPGKDPLQFNISNLHLRDVGPSKPFTYDAQLVNPKPVGDVHATGHVGPWNSEDPSQTALDGDYSFDHADLNTIKGIGGILSSTGHFAGVLEKIAVDGTTDTPNFSLDVSEHPVPLRTRFHAIVDGTSGDTYLEPVQAHLLHSDFTARGKVVLVKGKGHDIALDVDIPHARMEDMLRLGVKTTPPLMNGILTMKTRLHIPPGNVRVPAKLELAGNFAVRSVRFNNPQLQDKVDGLSLRAQGKPKEVQEASQNREAEVRSDMKANFALGHGLMTVNDLHYEIPGAHVHMNGVYSLDGNVFEFKGHVRTDATASHMVTGWKSWLLKPVDPFLKKNGAGVQLPIAVSGTQGDVHFGLALHGSADQTSAEMAQDLKLRKQAMLEDAKAKRDEQKARKAQQKADNSAVGEREYNQHKAAKEQNKAERHRKVAEAERQPQ